MSLVVAGTGTQVLAGNNTYSGGTTIQSGALAISNDYNLGVTTGTSSGALTLTGGTLQATAGFTLSSLRPVSVGAATINVATGNLVYAGAMTGVVTGSLTKSGTGSLQLDGANTFTGMTTVNVGALSGTGSLGGPLVVNAPGQVAPGDNTSGYFGGAGTLTVPAATLNSGAALDVDLGTHSDLLAVAGALTLGGGTVNVQNSGGLTTGTYEIMSYGSLANPFTAGSLFVGNMPTGYVATVAAPPGVKSISTCSRRPCGAASTARRGTPARRTGTWAVARRPMSMATRWSSSTGPAPAA